MIKRVLIIGALYSLLVAPAHAETPGDQWEVDYSLGHRQDKFDWNIAADLSGTLTPNILSELSWDLKMIEVGASLSWFARKPYFALIEASYAYTYDGENQDSDYLGDNRTLEFSRSNNNADDSDVFNYRFGFGYRIGERPTIDVTTTSLTPVLGFAGSKINMKMTDGVQTIATGGITPPLGPFDGLHSSYDADLSGLFFGARFIYDQGRSYRVFANYYYHHDVDYDARAVWNLRTDFAQNPSFIHSARGKGQVLEVGMILNITEAWTTTLKYRAEDWQIDAGSDITYLANGSIGITRLNEANWESSSISLSIYRRY